MDVILRSETESVEVDRSLVVSQFGGRYLIRRGAETIAAEDWKTLAYYAQYALDILALEPQPRRIAIVGGGTCILPRLLGSIPMIDVYELDSAIVDWIKATFHQASTRWRLIAGPYEETLRPTARYDVVFFDVAGPMPEWVRDKGALVLPRTMTVEERCP
jgi:spermidine synthase